MAKTKKEKSFEQMLDESLVKEKERPYKIPDNWIFTKLGSVCSKPQYGWTTKAADKGSVQLLRTTDITSGDIDWHTVPFCTKTPGDLTKYLLNDGDIVISRAGSIGVSYLIRSPQKSVFASYLIRFKPNINKEYLFLFLKSPYYWNSISEKSAGIALQNINATKLSEITFPLAPLEEQKRIVKKLYSMLVKLKEARELVQEAKDSFENRRATILNKAFNGELTKKWRYENPIIDSPSLKTSLEAIPYKIPDQWKWVFLKDVSDKFQYGTSAKSEMQGEVPVIRMGNIQHGKIDWNDLKFTSDKTEIEKYNLNFNDVLFNRTNSPELVGKTAIYKGEMPAIFAGYLIKIKPQKHLNPDYLNYFLDSPHAKQKCLNVKTDGVNQSNINAKKLGNFELPIPHKKEQQEIVKILNEIFVKEITTDELIDLEEHFDLLEKSILSKAFRGELGTNNPEDEPAIKLLEKALQSKKLTPAKPKTRRKGITGRQIISTSLDEFSENAQALLKDIKRLFGNTDFNTEKLRDKSNLPYEDFKNSLFELLESKLTMEFDENEEVITYQLKK